MARLQADASSALWVPVTRSFGFKGRRHRKAAIRMLMQQASGSTGVQTGGKVFAWLISQAAPAMMRKADGRVLVWMWKDDPGLVVAMAQLQVATPQMRTARAMMPMEYDDTVSFRNPHLGEGEKLVMKVPKDTTKPPFATYTWDLGTHIVILTAVGADRERFGTVDGSLDDLARTLRVVDDLTVDENNVLRLDPS
ncbi:hypothetical protein PU630_15075 [Microbacterium horticulturae]|uniref:Uncharacterized protein n=1 Tax=Microbacterium horticulturae TaxID=3028316 RepID=A0ABY8C106_9MICO|nr:hypothetical protein [Microbacterium sp. KACC 23027]WEG08548.1 hypothetical protein PU630_15075 [Microbacterium sp. KACC 23027]